MENQTNSMNEVNEVNEVKNEAQKVEAQKKELPLYVTKDDLQYVGHALS
jgi:hypothetical protein